MIRTLMIALACAALATFAPAQDKFAPMGEFEGSYLATGLPEVPASAVVVPQGGGMFRVTVQSASGGKPIQIELQGLRGQFWGKSNGVEWEGKVEGDALTIQRLDAKYGGEFKLKRIERKSPTEGKPAPAGAIVLLPFKEGEKTSLEEWTNQDWKLVKDGSVEVGKGTNVTKRQFKDYQLHVEYWLPDQTDVFGQHRSNSGIFMNNQIEVQVLDSFGLVPGSGDAGSIYLVKAPSVNASLPPMRWQTYDITFRSPRVNADGSLKEPARLSVEHNGVKIHENVEVTHPTAVKNDPLVGQGPISLQDHRAPVRYRNIWLVETKE